MAISQKAIVTVHGGNPSGLVFLALVGEFGHLAKSGTIVGIW